ncbi:MAG: integral rane sensor signal transduction histidine kinase, partial [Magnetococcales bacterium]|nr:integral rane sensor signal transduction histidine kinase [Magnetococcales bacterium]
MSLRSRISIILAIIMTLQVILALIVQGTIVTPRFIALEKKEAAKDLDRALESIQRERKHVALLASDWSAWEDAYEFVHKPTPGFIASNLSPEALEGIRVNLLYFYDLQGNLVWGKYYDTEKKSFVAWNDLPTRIDDSMRSLITHKDENDFHSELILTSTGPMLLAARPIVHVGFKGPIRGTLMMGRLLDQKLLKELVDQTHVAFEIFTAEADGKFSQEYRAIAEKLVAGPPVLWLDEGEGHRARTDKKEAGYRVGFTLVHDYRQRPGLLLRSATPKDITKEGNSAFWGTLLSNLVQGMVVLGVLLVTLHRIIIRPLTNLNAHIANVATHGDLTRRTD